MIIVGTQNARAGLIEGMKQLKSGASAIDAVEAAIKVIEADPEETTVGFGGFPNLLGDIELDASIMCGKTLRCGAVGAVKNYLYPISIARKVMDVSPHVFLVGEGAERFAEAVGFTKSSLKTDVSEQFYTEMMTQGKIVSAPADSSPLLEQKDRYNDWLSPYIEQQDLRDWHRKILAKTHGTVNVIALDQEGNLCSGVSTSGRALKFPGRLGDSPVIGAGNYADNRYGAAACVGVGELAIRLATARMVVEDLKRGASPDQSALSRIKEVKDMSSSSSFTILVLNNNGITTSATNEHWKTYFVMGASMKEPEERNSLTL